MALRTFTGRTLQEVLHEVHRTLGVDAVILNTRMRSDGWKGLLFGIKRVEVTAADPATVDRARGPKRREQPRETLAQRHAAEAQATVGRRSDLGDDEYEAEAQAEAQAEDRSGLKREEGNAHAEAVLRNLLAAAMREQKAAQRGAFEATGDAPGLINGVAPGKNGRVATVDGPTPPVPNGAARSALLQRAYAANVSLTPRQHAREAQHARHAGTTPSPDPMQQAEPAQTRPTRPTPVAGAPAFDASQFAAELAAIRRVVDKLEAGQKRERLPLEARDRLSDPLADQYLALLEQEVEEELVAEIVSEARAKLSEADRENAEACRKAVRRAIAKLLPTMEGSDADEMKARRVERDRPRVVALVGPTGVGKTTTIAKLAATHTLKHGQRVGLISTDEYRVGGADQLREYADILGVTLRVVRDVASARQAMDAFAEDAVEVVFVDTSGVSPREPDRLRDLESLLTALRPDERHLVLASNASESSMRRSVELFKPLATQRILFTKLDEAVTFGVLLNVSRAAAKRLSFVTQGQRVPEDIESSNADQLAGLLVRGSADAQATGS